MENLTLADFGSIASILSLIIGLIFGFISCNLSNKKIKIRGNDNTTSIDVIANDYVGRDDKSVFKK